MKSVHCRRDGVVSVVVPQPGSGTGSGSRTPPQSRRVLESPYSHPFPKYRTWYVSTRNVLRRLSNHRL